MSHFRTGVIISKNQLEKAEKKFNFSNLVSEKNNETIILESVEDILKYYDEELEVRPYVLYSKAEVIEKIKKELDVIKSKGIDNTLNTKHEKYLKAKELIEKILKDENNEKLLLEFAKDIVFEKHLNDNYEYMSKCNPNSKYDYYMIMAEDSGIIKNLKTGKSVNMAYIKDIRENKNDYCFLDRVYAYVDETKWYAPGTVGFFGCDNSTEESINKYNKDLKEYAKQLKDDDVFVLIDCHI